MRAFAAAESPPATIRACPVVVQMSCQMPSAARSAKYADLQRKRQLKATRGQRWANSCRDNSCERQFCYSAKHEVGENLRNCFRVARRNSRGDAARIRDRAVFPIRVGCLSARASRGLVPQWQLRFLLLGAEITLFFPTHHPQFAGISLALIKHERGRRVSFRPTSTSVAARK